MSVKLANKLTRIEVCILLYEPPHTDRQTRDGKLFPKILRENIGKTSGRDRQYDCDKNNENLCWQIFRKSLVDIWVTL